MRNLQETHLNRARASLRQALSWYGYLRKSGQLASNPELAGLVKPELEALSTTLNKLDSNVIKIAAFGLVSRGKSAVLNALLGDKVLQTGPLNGVTQWPRSVRWQPGGKVQVELIDTPGLDEIEGESRAQMATEVARQADLILFVVSGDITRTEYEALLDLRQAQKPLILVFNKIDLYPDTDRAKIYQNLQQLGAGHPEAEPLLPDEIVMVAAEPAPMEVRVEWPDGSVTYEWETPPTQVDELKQTILNILNREGRSLLALNALIQAREAEAAIAQKTIDLRQREAEEIIWQFTKYKALVVGLNPIAVLDILGGAIADLLLIRSLARLYGLPITSYEAGKILKTILLSSGGLLLSELGSSFLFGLGKSTAALASGDNPINITASAGSAIAQAGIAGYGAYAVGKAAQVYLENGCTWGQLGANTVIQEILSQVEPNTIVYRLRQELGGGG
ncbi:MULTISPECIES: GTP-binding protein [unclassified Tolypothrix]|uniref:GTP-binding protein n=1 Tax=unclassified Tolypothrix TaxID=2649714 RepID=UPI000A617278|nr:MULTISPECIES: GTP-binding protein [unclassified Tolypothrix]MBE9087986.1 GTP-binding protein [Tolypothrix sp. LEGE 11397]UYD29757.1 GTP-binding protein [Tolypothrix sp. PCC 7712]UYD37810.1 GTP-binding protein [Tolypothrix sp. PCC 7601]BAY92772.1 small GTP-binding protein domain-containing protein [Microchaete diplosiphon NIES-3275]